MYYICLALTSPAILCPSGCDLPLYWDPVPVPGMVHLCLLKVRSRLSAVLVWQWSRAWMCSHCCPTPRTRNLRKLCALDHLPPAPLPSWDGTEDCQSGQLDEILWSQKRLTVGQTAKSPAVSLRACTRESSKPSHPVPAFSADPDTFTRLTEGQTPYHHGILHRKWILHSCLAIWTASSLIIHVWAVCQLFRKEQRSSNKSYTTVPIRCAPQWTLMCTYISNTRVRLVIPSGCRPLIHKIPPYISPCPLTPSPPCLCLLVMETDLGVPVPVIFYPRQKKISAVSR